MHPFAWIKLRWQTLLSFAILLVVVASAAGYGYWLSRPFTLENLEPVDRPTLIHTITADQRRPFTNPLQWNARGDLLAVSGYEQHVYIYSIAGELIADLNSPLFLGPYVKDLEWHPSKDILAVSYDETIVLWSVDGTIIKQIDSGAGSSLLDFSWNIATEQLAVNQYYVVNNQYYHQIVLFDATGMLVEKFPQKITFVIFVEWLNAQELAITTFYDGIFVLNTDDDTLKLLIDKEYYKFDKFDVEQQSNAIIANSSVLNQFIYWKDGKIDRISAENIDPIIISMNPHSTYTLVYDSSNILKSFNHTTLQFQNYAQNKFSPMAKTIVWHPHKSVVATLVGNQIQLWQFPE